VAAPCESLVSDFEIAIQLASLNSRFLLKEDFLRFLNHKELFYYFCTPRKVITDLDHEKDISTLASQAPQ
jgi:hypothetical protein